ncbi:hypothetical protein HTG_03455 [Natrinema mahii]|uniref:Uncharacterized protein n=1 Tax=Natrinema thermotolerans TaxID=121872 RepID=A0AAF0PC58_9EURY|nr:hypothetical protein [Natrinema thermotolerans]ELZ12357.1 hypothetical protein C478_09786 [Natrinema thermotolerans DSM 11552]OAQ54626.1 hypothetical protein HTG_03455 [Natrinema mahii]QCC59813.1 hypothetical protein DVR14_14720 [Natrinema thermotolerans]WMT06804.1 hypothetical protein NP511_15595 [Natrinema thermotolerans]
MSFPEGPRKPGEQSALEDDADHVDHAPTDGLISTVRESIRRHVRTWADRYVEMRVEARTDGRT